MAKILKTNITTYADVLKQRKFESIAQAKEQAVALKVQKEFEFDKFVKNTVRDILNDSFGYEVRVVDGNVHSLLLNA